MIYKFDKQVADSISREGIKLAFLLDEDCHMNKIYVLWLFNENNERVYIEEINMRCKEEKHLKLTPFKEKAKRFTYNTSKNIAIMNWWSEKGPIYIEPI